MTKRYKQRVLTDDDPADEMRAERIAALKPVETMTDAELELIEIFRAIEPEKRAALLTIVRMQTERPVA